jgi:diadenosine tetraphosphate (Ap4A) HIT family hydrolase
LVQITTPHTETANLRFQSGETFDAPLRESKHFLCVASLGSIVPGWVLITPKRPLINFSLLEPDERSDLRELLPQVRREVRDHFGTECAFEHGAVGLNSLTGCGVDQAHLHVVAVEPSLLEAAATDGSWRRGGKRLPFEICAGDREYLWLSSASEIFFTHPSRSVSQYFRRAIAAVVGVPEFWDYKAHPFHENIRETQRALGDGIGVSRLRAA